MTCRLLTGALITLTALLPATQPICGQQQLTVAEAQRRLLQLTVPDEIDTAVPIAVKHAIIDLKQALVVQTDATIARLPGGVTASSVQQHLAAVMPASTVGKLTNDLRREQLGQDSNQPVSGLYGGELSFTVKQPDPSLLLVQEAFDIACGSDNILLAYSRGDGHWKRILLWQSKPYDKVSGAFGDTYETLPLAPRHDNHPLLLVVHGTPWCTSTMSSFDMDVFKLGDAKATPTWHRTHQYRRADLDPPLTLRPTPNGFEVRASVSGGGDEVYRKGVMRYSVMADGIHRVQPLAMNARDSVVEWLTLPRNDAADFADDPSSSLTWQMFQDFTYEGKGERASVPYPHFGAVRACKDSNTHFQAEVTSEYVDGPAKDRLGPAYFVQLRSVQNGYRIHAVSRGPDRSCSGPDLMAGH